RDDISGAGDPVVAFDRDGNVFISMISIGVREFVLGSISSQVAVMNMAVATSYDGGLTWTEPQLAASGAVSTVSNIDAEGKERGTITTVDLDKPWMIVGPDPEDPDKDILYLSYTEFEQTSSVLYADELAFLSNPFLGTQIKVVASRDGGQTWGPPVAVSEQVFAGFSLAAPGQDTAQQQTGVGSFASRVVQGSQLATLSDGTLAVSWYDSTDDGNDTGLATVGFSTSTDGGTSFSRPIVAATYREAPYRLRTANFRYGALPSMAAGPGGELYIVQASRSIEDSVDDSDVFLYRSFDTGESWDPGIQVNQDDTDASQFFPQVTVGPDGIVHIMWGDQRDDPTRLKYHIYYTQSTDQGATFGFTLEDQGFTVPDTRVTDFPSNPMKGFPGGRFIGDYMALAATEEDVFLVWPDTRLGEYGGYSQQIGFARKTALEPPSLFLSPPSGSAGRVVDIQGFGFQPDSGIQLYVSGVITAQLRSDDAGQFQTSIYMPLTGEGPTEIRAFDD
ncbi:MAG: exo-alpha-sialidase, partial [Thermomicrobiales bacterium]|nr:exo-alpha-sialidase [Thermomicrobiales bacterium]